MKILLINYHHLDSNSGIHIFNIANQLISLGVDCAVCVPNGEKRVFELGEPLFETFTPAEIHRNNLMDRVDLVHVWTPREITRQITANLLKLHKRPYIVHLEDNEEFLIEILTNFSADKLRRVPGFLLNLLIRKHISHPTRHLDFLLNSDGVTHITEALVEHCPPNLPHEFISAGYQEDMPWHMPTDPYLKNRLGIPESDFIVAYTGNVHRANHDEVAVLYEAVKEINELGTSVKLIRTGSNFIPLQRSLSHAKNKSYFIELGRIPRRDLPAILSIADVLVQPGTSNRFNDYRFPSKIPEYLASGKPVILPRTNIGLHLKNNEECILLENGSTNELVEKIQLLLGDEALRRKIGAQGRQFAEQHLRWSIIARKLLSFYHLVMERQSLNR